MKTPTGELLHLRAEANAEPTHTGFTGALELYDELINFLGLSPIAVQQTTSPQDPTNAITPPEPVAPPPAQTASVTDETASQARPPAPVDQPAVVSSEASQPAKAVANSGALSQTEDVIRITGALAGFVASRTVDSAMILCGDCGKPSDSSEMFCIHCSGLLEEPAARAEPATLCVAGFCDDCGAMVESDEIFCLSCGSVMANA
jgi:Double zinc ribbon